MEDQPRTAPPLGGSPWPHQVAATDPAWHDDYRRRRPMVERAVAWLVARGNRRLRYRGTHANDRRLRHRAAALNLRRLTNLGLPHTNGIWTPIPIPAWQEGEPVSCRFTHQDLQDIPR